MEDLRFAAWFLWMMPLDAALSRALPASAARTLASSAVPASAASRNLRTEVFRADLTALLRSCAASFCRLRLICDLMFATGARLSLRLLAGVVKGVRALRPDTRGNDISARTPRPNRASGSAGAPRPGDPGVRPWLP